MVRVGPVRRVGSGNLRWPELVDLQRVRGAGANKRRPAVIVTNDGANHPAVRLGRGVVTVVPVTSNVGRLPVPGVATGGRLPADHDSKAHAEQVRSIDVGRSGCASGQFPTRSSPEHGSAADSEDHPSGRTYIARCSRSPVELRGSSRCRLRFRSGPRPAVTTRDHGRTCEEGGSPMDGACGAA